MEAIVRLSCRSCCPPLPGYIERRFLFP